VLEQPVPSPAPPVLEQPVPNECDNLAAEGQVKNSVYLTTFRQFNLLQALITNGPPSAALNRALDEKLAVLREQWQDRVAAWRTYDKLCTPTAYA
jgi:hypothetical protein